MALNAAKEIVSETNKIYAFEKQNNVLFARARSCIWFT